jgi:hypothetical protein
MWWWRNAIALWLKESKSWISCLWSYWNCGREKLEDKFKNLKEDIEALVWNYIHADAKLKTTFKYCRLSAREIRERLIKEKWYKKDDFQIRAMSDVLNRLWYSLKKT